MQIIFLLMLSPGEAAPRARSRRFRAAADRSAAAEAREAGEERRMIADVRQGARFRRDS